MTMPRKIALAYSGGLDTSVMCRWLQETHDAEVVTFTADIGQGAEVEPAREKAEALGVREVFIEDLTGGVRGRLRLSHVSAPMRSMRGSTCLVPASRRPLIAKRLVEVAAATGADAIAHGATGKGNDQVRFELCRLRPQSRHRGDRSLAVAGVGPATPARPAWPMPPNARFPWTSSAAAASPYSMDANLLHISYEGGGLEDPGNPPDEEHVALERVAPSAHRMRQLDLDIDFAGGDASALDGEAMSPAALLRAPERDRRRARRGTQRHRREPLLSA